MATGDVTEGVRTAQHGQSGGQGDPEETDAQLHLFLGQEQRRQHRGATNAEDQPERTEELRAQPRAERGCRMG
jgi:hypothetical protein